MNTVCCILIPKPNGESYLLPQCMGGALNGSVIASDYLRNKLNKMFLKHGDSESEVDLNASRCQSSNAATARQASLTPFIIVPYY